MLPALQTYFLHTSYNLVTWSTLAGLLPGPSELHDSPEYSLCWAPAASPADRDQEVSLAYTPYFPLHYLESPSFFVMSLY